MADIAGGALCATEQMASRDHAAADAGAYFDEEHVIPQRRAAPVLADCHQVHVVFD